MDSYQQQILVIQQLQKTHRAREIARQEEAAADVAEMAQATHSLLACLAQTPEVQAPSAPVLATVATPPPLEVQSTSTLTTPETPAEEEQEEEEDGGPAKRKKRKTYTKVVFSCSFAGFYWSDVPFLKAYMIRTREALAHFTGEYYARFVWDLMETKTDKWEHADINGICKYLCDLHRGAYLDYEHRVAHILFPLEVNENVVEWRKRKKAHDSVHRQSRGCMTGLRAVQRAYHAYMGWDAPSMSEGVERSQRWRSERSK